MMLHIKYKALGLLVLEEICSSFPIFAFVKRVTPRVVPFLGPRGLI